MSASANANYRMRPRLSIDVEDDFYQAFDETIPTIVKGPLLRAVYNQLLEAIQEHGLVLAYFIIDGKVKLFQKEK